MKKLILILIVLFSFSTIYSQTKKSKGKKQHSSVSKIVDGYDFFDSPSSYVGKTVSLIVSYSTYNDFVINNQEQIDEDGQKYWDYSCSCMRPKDPYRKISKKNVNWKKFRDATSQNEFTVNIPQSFFDNNLIPNGFGKGFLLLTIYVYTGENRGGNGNGVYSENPNVINYELKSIKRYR
jgi:hypothetical protein